MIVGVALAKSALPEADIETFEQLLFLAYTLTIFWVSGLSQGLLVLYPKLSTEQGKRLTNGLMIVFSLITALIGLAFVVAEPGILYALLGQYEIDYFDLFIWYMLLNIPSFLVEYIYILQQRARRLIFFAVVSFGGYVLAVSVPPLVGWPFEYSFYALIALSIFRLVWLGFLASGYRPDSDTWLHFKQLVKLATPLLLYTLLANLTLVTDGMVVSHFLQDDNAFLMFRYGARELPIAVTLAAATSNALLPIISDSLEQGIVTVKERGRQLMHWLYPLSIVLMLTSEWFFPLVFRDTFVEAAVVFNVYLLLILSRLVFPQTLLIGMGDTRWMLTASIIETLLNVGLSIWWVQLYGLMGVAAATVVAFFFEKIFLAVVLYRKTGIGVQRYIDLRWLTAYSTLLIAAWIWTLI